LFGQVFAAARIGKHPLERRSAFGVLAAVFAQPAHNDVAGNQSEANGLSVGAAWREDEESRADRSKPERRKASGSLFVGHARVLWMTQSKEASVRSAAADRMDLGHLHVSAYRPRCSPTRDAASLNSWVNSLTNCN
jgi:hypothetical protein